ncbi:tubulin-folding cofactor E [Silene latifolia]|uniref:tubulin-folding cofactor E n=1 Tax=Silene latifolia TaxID=37657 RepID=UPI003D77E879
MESSEPEFKIGQRVHSIGDTRRIGTVKYVGPVDGYSGTWVGVDWDNADAKHDGSLNGISYFKANSEFSGSFVRPRNLSSGITLLDGLYLRYRAESTREEEDEMYVYSASNKKVSIQLVGSEKIQKKLSHFEELASASVAYLGVSSAGPPSQISKVAPNLKELDLTGNLLSDWKDIADICQELPFLTALNLTNNSLAVHVTCLPVLSNIRVLVLNSTGVKWTQIEELKQFLPCLDELHLMGNEISEITPTSSRFVQGFDSLRVLNLEDNCISEWDEIVKLSELTKLEQLHLNKNNLSQVSYPSNKTTNKSFSNAAFQHLRCILLGANDIADVESVDSLNSFPSLTEVRLSENPIADPVDGGVPRFVLIARLAKIEILNGSEVSVRERKESEIRYVRLVMSKFHDKEEDIKRCHPRFYELRRLHGLEEERPSNSGAGPQKMSSGLLSITLKCVGASMGEKAPLTKKLPATTTVGKLKILSESLFKLKSVKTKLFLQEEGSPLPIQLVNEMDSLLDAGVGNESTILIDEET